jgi:CheY-like chemotaxis protein
MCCSAKGATAKVPAVAIDSLTPSSCRVLLVEDHLDTAMLMRRVLARRGYEVVVATTLAEAHEALQITSSFDLLLSDLTLPDGSGLDLARDVSTHPGTLPAIALSGHATTDDVRASIEAGFFAHLTKPVDIDKLWAVMDRVLVSRAA